MPSPLENLSRPGGQLTPELADAREFARLRDSGLRSLADARLDISLESRFLLAYNAAHSLCLAALRHKAYRAQSRYIVFQVLPHTLGLGPEVWKVLAKAHERRNLAEYQGELDVTEQLVEDVIAACVAVERALHKLTPL